MTSKNPVDVLLGTHTIGDTTIVPGVIHFDKRDDVAGLLNKFYDRGYRQIDTGRNYPGSEARLGEADAPSRFTIHTKILGMGDNTLNPAQIKESIETSLNDLKVDHVQTMFLHMPDRQTPFEDTAKAMDEAQRQGKFTRWGLSNYAPAEVQRYIDICEEHGYAKPSVYQGHYNALVRGGEKELFPLLRKYNMSFFAYSPAAGGFFSRSTSSSSRWSNDNGIGQIYNANYGHPSVQASVDAIEANIKKHGITGHAAALRWTRFHSALDSDYGDGIIFAVSKIGQLDQTLDALGAGPLPDDLAEAMTALYKTIEGPGEPAYHL